MTASEVMSLARAELNDVGSQIFNDAFLLPFVQSSYLVLQSSMQENSLPTTFETSSALAITAGATTVSTSSTPPLPLDIIEPTELFERGSSTERWVKMTELRETRLPFSSDLRNTLGVWKWAEDEIKFVGSTANRDVLVRYIKSLVTVSSGATELGVRGALLYLAYKTAAGASEALQNRSRADRLESKAQIELAKFINIRVKGQQGIPVRRIPYGSRRNSWQSPLPY